MGSASHAEIEPVSDEHATPLGEIWPGELRDVEDEVELRHAC